MNRVFVILAVGDDGGWAASASATYLMVTNFSSGNPASSCSTRATDRW